MIHKTVNNGEHIQFETVLVLYYIFIYLYLRFRKIYSRLLKYNLSYILTTLFFCFLRNFKYSNIKLPLFYAYGFILLIIVLIWTCLFHKATSMSTYWGMRLEKKVHFFWSLFWRAQSNFLTHSRNILNVNKQKYNKKKSR